MLGAEAAAQDPQGQEASGLSCTGTPLGANHMGTEELDLPTVGVGQCFLFQWKQKLRTARKREAEPRGGWRFLEPRSLNFRRR